MRRNKLPTVVGYSEVKRRAVNFCLCILWKQDLIKILYFKSAHRVICVSALAFKLLVVLCKSTYDS